MSHFKRRMEEQVQRMASRGSELIFCNIVFKMWKQVVLIKIRIINFIKKNMYKDRI